MTYRIRLEVEAGKLPLTAAEAPSESEVVEVEANSLQDARARSMLYARLKPQGRPVRFFNDESGEELLGRW
jgi:hypothetical protein